MFSNKFGNSTAIINEDGSEVSYSEIFEKSLDIKNKISSHDLVLLCADNSFESILIYYSCLLHKIPLMIINEDVDGAQLLQILNKYEPNYIFSKNRYDFENHIFTNISTIFNSYKFFKQKKYKKLEINDQLSLMLSTSGSTGSIKFVRLSEANLKSNSSAIAKYLKLKNTDTAITTMPMSYTYGLSIISSHLSIGAKVVVTNKTVLDRDFWNLISEYNVTSISGVPYFYEILIKTGFLKRKIPSLRYITQAGGKLDKINKLKLLSFCESAKISFFVMYGQTEATARMSYVPPKVLKEKIDSIGIPIDKGKFHLKDSGEIVFEGPNVSMGYAQSSKDLIKGDDNNGLLHTGDIGYQDKDGYYFITGRSKRFVKIYGLRISLDEIESMLEINFPDNEFLCIDNNNKVKIQYTNELDEKKLIMFIAKKLKLNNKAFEVAKIIAIPRNKSGKKVYI